MTFRDTVVSLGDRGSKKGSDSVLWTGPRTPSREPCSWIVRKNEGSLRRGSASPHQRPEHPLWRSASRRDRSYHSGNSVLRSYVGTTEASRAPAFWHPPGWPLGLVTKSGWRGASWRGSPSGAPQAAGEVGRVLVPDAGADVLHPRRSRLRACGPRPYAAR